MYKMCALILFLSMFVTGICAVNATELDLEKEVSGDIFGMTLKELQEQTETKSLQRYFHFRDMPQNISSPERKVGYHVLVNEDAVLLEQSDYEILCRIVEAEAGGEDEMGRMLVANVVLNRVESSRFPNTVKDVVFQSFQFTPVATGRYYSVKVSEKTREAVARVLNGEDESQGALFFVNRYAANPESMLWFDTRCTPLFTHGGHEFFS